VQQDDHSAHAAVTHQRVAPQAEDRDRLEDGQLAQEQREIVTVGRNVCGVGPTAGTPGRVRRQRGIEREHPAQTGELAWLDHVHDGL